MEHVLNYLSGLLASNQFLQGGFVLAILTWIGYQVKAIPTLLGSKIRYYATYTIHFDQGSEFYRVFSEWLHETHPAKFRNVEIKFYGESDREPGEPQAVIAKESGRGRRFELRWHQYSDANIIRHRNRLLWITKDRARLDSARDIRAMFYNSYTITGFFAKAAIEDLCEQIAIRKNAEVEENALRVYFNANGYFESQHITIVKPLDHIFFDQKRRLLADLQEFMSRKAMYAEKGIKYKRSYLFYGPGGTGKTSLGLAIARHLNYDLYVINLAAIKSDHELQNLAPRIGKRSVILLEDIDCILKHRDVKSKKVNFSTILN
ncbi:MAG TPA: AAA family ATPase, partial [Pyrinomonadaceae bacterium]|nr:AAA family ATPase [Pyrinomonadaceae bacterium]